MFAPVNEIARLTAQYAIHLTDVASNCNEHKLRRNETGRKTKLISVKYQVFTAINMSLYGRGLTMRIIAMHSKLYKKYTGFYLYEESSTFLRNVCSEKSDLQRVLTSRSSGKVTDVLNKPTTSGEFFTEYTGCMYTN
jgi:hypothetical protein